MTLLRDDQQAALADLNAFGGGLLARYRELAETGIHARLDAALAELIRRREPLLERIAHCESQRGDPPKAADVEPHQLQATADKLLGKLFGANLPVRRVREAERKWRERLEQARGLKWHPAERELFAELIADSDRALAQL